MAGQQFIGSGDGRWFQRADGIIFRMDDPSHIMRMLAEGWHEVDGPHAAPALRSDDDELPPVVETLAEVQARNAAARAAFSRTPPATGAPLKPIRKASEKSPEKRRA